MAKSAESLEDSVQRRLSSLQGEAQPQAFTIFRVPAYLREGNRTGYEPRMVSIGPYYHSAGALRAMEDHKWRYLGSLLTRFANTVTASTLISEIRPLEDRARACYSERPLLGSDDFVRMLLLDSCFILESSLKWHDGEHDTLCDVGWGHALITSDLLLLENQIPFFVLERLYSAGTGARGGGTEKLMKFLISYIGGGDEGGDGETRIAIPSSASEIHHLLHLYYESFVPKPPPQKAAAGQQHIIAKEQRQPKAIRCATELSAAGVTFVLRKSFPGQAHPPDIYDVVFNRRRGVMEIPEVEVNDMKRPHLINLIAFEQTLGGKGSLVVTSYVSLMSTLVRTTRDVELLRERRILDNLLADDAEAARFFSHLGDGGTMNYDEQVFAGLYADVHRYCNSQRHRYRALLMRDYFGSPWSAIAVVAAALVLALTFTQTYFTVFPRQ